MTSSQRRREIATLREWLVHTGHTSSLDRERPCDHEWSNDRPQGISKDASAGRGVPAPTPEGRTEPRRCLTSKPKQRKCCQLVFLFLDCSRPSVQPKLTCERHSVPIDVRIPVQCKCSVGKRRWFVFFLKIFSTRVHVHFFGHPSHSWAVAFDIHFDSCAGSAHHMEHSSIFLDSVLHGYHCFFFLLSMFTAIRNVGCDMSTSEAAQTSSVSHN